MKVRGLCVTGNVDIEGERLTDAALDDVAARIAPPLRAFWTLVDWRRVPNGVEVTFNVPEERMRALFERGDVHAAISCDKCERDPANPKVVTRVASPVRVQLQIGVATGTQGPMVIVGELDSARLDREARLTAHGFDEPTADERKANLALNVALREWPKDDES